MAGLAEYLATWLDHYRTFPNRVRNYWRNVPVVDAEDMVFTNQRKNPRMVAARLAVAKTTLHNVHGWLDRHAVPGRPAPEEPTEDEEAAYRQLSRLLVWLENRVRQEQFGKARQTLGEQKYTRRRGRPYGKSIVRPDQIE